MAIVSLWFKTIFLSMPDTTHTHHKHKLLLVGWDSADWKIIQPLVDEKSDVWKGVRGQDAPGKA